MPLSLIVKKKCPICNETAIETSRLEFGDEKIIFLKCGHQIVEASLNSGKSTELIAKNGNQLMPFQITGVKFLEHSACRCLIADEQGLGKTVQALAGLRLHFAELTPTVIIVKSAIKIQWMKQCLNWLDTNRIQIIFSSKEICVPGMDIYIMTYDMLKNDHLLDFIEPKLLILDECQQIKNHLSGRAKAVQKLIHRFEFIIALSGTPIKNNAGEYFTILNILQPLLFPEYNRFIREHCDSHDNQYGPKVGGLSDPDNFFELTKDFIIRRRLEDVLPDLFALRMPRKFHHVELDRKVHKAYGQAMQELEEMYYSDNENSAAIIAIMTKLRQITGVSKTEECTDFVDEFLDSNERKIAIFAHHHIAVDLLEAKINNLLQARGLRPCIMVRAGDDTGPKISAFADTQTRVIICSGLAAGEGMDGLQHLCSDMIILERQWNPANEEQIESRLIRFGQTMPVNITYMLASETIDEYFTELVEQKRAIVASTLDGKEMEWESANLMKELAEVLVTKGKKKWTI